MQKLLDKGGVYIHTNPQDNANFVCNLCLWHRKWG